MRFEQAQPDSPIITQLTRTIQDDRCTLRWLWPTGIDAVYIGRSPELLRGAAPERSGLKLYTRSEYKANHGYTFRLEGVGSSVYTVYACPESGSDPLLLLQPGGENSIAVSAGRARIRYGIRYKNSWLGKHKTVQITVAPEVPIGEDVLCYVKKQGGPPTSIEDGIRYPFITPFAAGRNVLPPIEIGKQEHIRLFFTDRQTYGTLYELIAE
ncbi:beta-mannanase [Paenibacillus sp. 1P07SE]|uniref:beta-mannanase n=1 Tax=Paenibacillus sp. 1P07SE TaxID=3132209 RepID=UPI0039A6C1C1